VNIRTFQPGDEVHQVAIYNEAAADLPRFKPATTQEVLRRVSARDFDPGMRFFACVDGQPVGYVLFNPNGRVSRPWCRRGHEAVAEPLFTQLLQTMRQRGFRQAFAAYRGDWTETLEFFRQHGFSVAREMINFVLDIFDMPTVPARRNLNIKPLERREVATVFGLAPQVLRCQTPQQLEQHLFENPYFDATSLFVLRSRTNQAPLGVGILITNPTYADPKAVDAGMPCFRLGAFGTEGMQSKRLKGLFSFLTKDDNQSGLVGVDLVAHAASQLQESDDIAALAAQVPSDAPYLLRFYQTRFRRQGSFPVLERNLSQ
jgi:hypothetical protein